MPQPAVRFAVEPLTDTLLDEALPLLVAHWREVSPFPDIPLQPDLAFYRAAYAAGTLRCLTARRPCRSFDVGDELVGYAFFFVSLHPHFRASRRAVQDALYLDPSMRGLFGMKFLRFCETALQCEGVEFVYQSVTPARDFSPLLRRMGYVPSDASYVHRLVS